MTEFDDLTKRILDKMDNMESKIDGLCVRIMRIEMDWQNHVKELDIAAKSKERRFYYIIALLGIGFTVQEIIRSVI